MRTLAFCFCVVILGSKLNAGWEGDFPEFPSVKKSRESFVEACRKFKELSHEASMALGQDPDVERTAYYLPESKSQVSDMLAQLETGEDLNPSRVRRILMSIGTHLYTDENDVQDYLQQVDALVSSDNPLDRAAVRSFVTTLRGLAQTRFNQDDAWIDDEVAKQKARAESMEKDERAFLEGVRSVCESIAEMVLEIPAPGVVKTLRDHYEKLVQKTKDGKHAGALERLRKGHDGWSAASSAD